MEAKLQTSYLTITLAVLTLALALWVILIICKALRTSNLRRQELEKEIHLRILEVEKVSTELKTVYQRQFYFGHENKIPMDKKRMLNSKL